jgi:HK97 family phage major capsid protein
MSDEVKQAVEAVNKAFNEFKSANDARIKELEAKGGVDPVLEAKLSKLEADMNAAQKVADEAYLAVKRAQRVVTDERGNPVDIEQKAHEWAAEASVSTRREVRIDAAGLDQYKSAFKRLIRANFNTDLISDVERKTLSVGQDSAGGYYVYPDLSGATIRKVYETSVMRAFATVQVIGTDALEGYYDNDEVGYGWTNELGSRPSTSTPGLGKWRIELHEMYAMPQASQQLLDDAIAPIESWLDGKIGDRFARAENTAFVAGSGTGQPRGFLTLPDSTDLTVGIEQFKTGVNGAFAAAPNGGDVLMNAFYGLKGPYRNNATWFMNTPTTNLVRKLKDSDGAYIWAASIAAGQPATLLGRAVAPFEDMPDPATGSLSIAVGDMRAAYQIVDRGNGIRMLRDPFTVKGSILFYASKRTGGAVVNGEALKLVQFAA